MPKDTRFCKANRRRSPSPIATILFSASKKSDAEILEAYRYATCIAIYFHQHHYGNTEFEPSGTLKGILKQIDKMVCDLNECP